MLTLRLYGGQPGDVLALQLDQARRRLLEAADHPQRGGLAAAGRAEQAEELAVVDLEVDVVDGEHLPVSLRDLDESNVDARHGQELLQRRVARGRRASGTVSDAVATADVAPAIGRTNDRVRGTGCQGDEVARSSCPVACEIRTRRPRRGEVRTDRSTFGRGVAVASGRTGPPAGAAARVAEGAGTISATRASTIAGPPVPQERVHPDDRHHRGRRPRRPPHRPGARAGRRPRHPEHGQGHRDRRVATSRSRSS